MMKPSDKSLLSFTRQNPLKILLKRLKMASQIGVEPTTFRLGADPVFCPLDIVKC